MRAIKISRVIAELYKQNRSEISYALTELSGMVDYDSCNALTVISLAQSTDTLDYEITDDLYEQLEANFGQLENIDLAVEILLWNNYFMGMNL